MSVWHWQAKSASAGGRVNSAVQLGRGQLPQSQTVGAAWQVRRPAALALADCAGQCHTREDERSIVWHWQAKSASAGGRVDPAVQLGRGQLPQGQTVGAAWQVRRPAALALADCAGQCHTAEDERSIVWHWQAKSASAGGRVDSAVQLWARAIAPGPDGRSFLAGSTSSGTRHWPTALASATQEDQCHAAATRQAKSPALTLGRWVTPIRYLSTARAASRPS